MVHVAFVMDPISGLNVKKDSTLALIRAAQMKGWKVSYMEQQDLYFDQLQPMAMLRSLEILAPFVDNLDPMLIPASTDSSWYRLGDEQPTPLKDLTAIFMKSFLRPRFLNATHH